MTTKQVNETMVLIPTKKIRTIRVAMESLIEGKEYPVVYDQELRDFVIYDELGDPWASLTDRIKMGIFNVIYIDASGDDRIDERAKQLVVDNLLTHEGQNASDLYDALISGGDFSEFDGVGVWDNLADVYDIEILAEDLAVGITNLIREIENK